MAQWICRKSQQKHNQEGPIILNIRNLLSALSFSTSPSSTDDGVLLLYDIRMRSEIFSSYRKTLANEDTEDRTRSKLFVVVVYD